MEELKEKLWKGDSFLIITGGPCYGKSALANELGHTMYDENEYNYVIWINMRDIPNPPQMEDVANKILKEFEIDTTGIKSDAEEVLRMKFESITATGKRALLIFDDADDLIAPPIDKSCKSSTFSELSRHIRCYSRETIRAIFTTRVYSNVASEEDHYIVKLEHLSNKESEEYLQQELRDRKGLNKEQMVRDITDACHGLPFALRLVCSHVNELRSIKRIEDDINDLKKDPLQFVGEDEMRLENVHLFPCFELSLKRLDESDLELLSVLAVFPSRFSYSYIKKLLSCPNVKEFLPCIRKDGSIKPRKLKKFEKHSLLQDDSHADGVNQEECASEEYYAIHSFFCQYIKDQYWNDSKEHCFQASYYKLYTNELFVLGRESLEKDSYVNSWIEFKGEQHNFDYVMAQIGKWCDQDDCPSHVKEAVFEMFKGSTPDFIAMCLFCIDVINSSLLLKFVEGCEKLADDGQKKSIWCCRYDLFIKYFDSEVEDPYKKLEPDKYGKALLDKWSISSTIQGLSRGKWNKKEFAQIKDDLQGFKDRVNMLECVALKNYFNFHILKLEGRLLKKGLNVKELNVTRDDCIKVYDDALDVCNECFGKSWFTVDCYNQRGKLFWLFRDIEKAITEFDKAIEIAESMSLRNSRRFGSCLLDKGRFLVDVGTEEMKKEGSILLQDVINRCSDYSDAKFWCQAMGSLLTIDKSRVKEVKERFFQTEKLDRSLVDVMEKAIKLDVDSSDETFEEEKFLENEEAKGKDLLRAIEKLDTYLRKIQDMKNWNDEHDDLKTRLFVWQMRAALRYTHVMLLSERKKFAKNALKLMETCSFIHSTNKDGLLAVVSQCCDAKEEELIRQMHFVDRIGIQLLKANKEDEFMQKCSTLLMNCEGYQKLWSSIVLKKARDRPFFFEKVTDFLVTQTEPCEDLLKLVLQKFEYGIRVYQREADESIIMEKSMRAVEDLRRAMEYIERELLAQMSFEMQGVVKSWYKSIALEADHCLLDDERRIYAEKVLQVASDLRQQEEKKLSSIISRKGTIGEQECRRKKALLCKVTKFMRQNGMQDDLEKKYDDFMIDCSSFHRIRFEMVKFILEKKNVEIQKFGKYLSYLVRDFQRGALTKGWDYQFVVDLADQLFSEEVDRSSQMDNFNTYQWIFDSRNFIEGYPNIKKKLEFEFLVIFALKGEKEIRDFSVRKQDAQRALKIFPLIEQKDKDYRL